VNVPGATVVFRVELRCLACGRDIGVLETPRWPTCGRCLFKASVADSAICLPDWSRLRCSVCRGNVYADEVRTIRKYPPVAWDDDESHRRGRPPKWLVALRMSDRDVVGD
jgi:hypothetical protein